MENERDKTGICTVDVHKQLLDALTYSDLTKFIHILNETEVNLNKVLGDPIHGTLLDACCRENRKSKFVEYLLKHGANPNIINGLRKKGPIHFATLANDPETINVLLEHEKTDVNLIDNTGSTALHYAIKEKLDDIVSSLLKHHEINVNIINRKGKTPLHHAIEVGNEKYIELLLYHDDIDTEITDPSGKTIRDIIQERFPGLEEIYLKSKGTPKKKSNDSPSTSKMFSLLRDLHFSNFITLIGENKTILEEHDGTYTFLQYCCVNGIDSVADALLKNSVSPNTTHPNNLQTPLMLAASKGFVYIVKLLVNNADTTFEAVDGETALHCVIKGSCETKGLREELTTERNHLECLNILLDDFPHNKLNINQKDTRGNTALHYAAKQASHDMVLKLLEAGAYIGVDNKSNEPACADITLKTFETHLDRCISTNMKLPREDNYAISFNYKCLIPFENAVSRGSNECLQNAEAGLNKPSIAKLSNFESEPLVYIAQNSELRPLLKHPIFTSFLHLKWHKIRLYFFVNLILYSFFCVFFTAYILKTFSNNDSITTNNTQPLINNDGSVKNNSEILKNVGSSSILWFFATLFLIFLILREFFQLSISPFKYIWNVENWLEIGIIFVAILILFSNRFQAIRHQLSAIGILLTWAELVLLIGRHPSLSTNIEMLKTVSWNFLKFLAWYSLLILAFALSFHSLFKDAEEEENSFEDPGVSIFRTIVMLTGEFDTASIPFIYFPITSHVLFVLFIFFIAIVLFNLLNGLAVSDTQAIKSDAELVGYVSRVKLVSYIERILSNPGFCDKMSSKTKSICCCITNLFWNYKTHLFSRQFNLFQPMCLDYEINIFSNLGNKVEINKQKNAWDYNKSSCLDDCNNIYMDPQIVKTAKQILIKKSLEKDQLEQRGIYLEKEKMLTQMITKCKEMIEENRKMLIDVNRKLQKLSPEKLNL